MRIMAVIKSRINYDIIVILLFGALLRFPGILHGLPTYVLPSESEIISMSVAVLKGDFFYSWTFYGGLYFYLNAVLIGIIHIFYHSLYYIGLVQNIDTPYMLFYAASRGMNVLFGLILISSVYGIANRVSGRRAGVIAALIMALLPLPHTYSLQIAPDLLCTTLASVSIYFSVKHLSEKAGNRWLWLAALFSGLAIGTKYLFFSIVPFCAAKYFRDRENKVSFFDKRLIHAIGIVILTFLITTPISVLYIKQFFINGLLYAHKAYTSVDRPGAGAQNIPLAFIQSLFFNDLTPGIFLVSFAGFIIYAVTQFRKWMVISLGPLLWTILMCFYQVDVTNNIMILLTPLCVCAGIAIYSIPKRLLRYAVILVISIYPFMKEALYLNTLLKKDIRYSASEWIDKNIPQGSCVAWEDHRPFFNNEKFKCIHIGTCALAYMTPESVRNAGYEYVVSDFYEPMKHKPGLYKKEIDNYKKLLKEFEMIQEFEPGNSYCGNRVRIIKIR